MDVKLVIFKFTTIIILICQELLAYIVAYLIINIIYRELLVRRSECQEETDGNCRQVMMALMSAEINISRSRGGVIRILSFLLSQLTCSCALGM